MASAPPTFHSVPPAYCVSGKDTRSPGHSGCSCGGFKGDVRTPAPPGQPSKSHGYSQGNHNGFSVRQSSLSGLFSARTAERNGAVAGRAQPDKLGRAAGCSIRYNPAIQSPSPAVHAKNGAHHLGQKLIGRTSSLSSSSRISVRRVSASRNATPKTEGTIALVFLSEWWHNDNEEDRMPRRLIHIMRAVLLPGTALLCAQMLSPRQRFRRKYRKIRTRART